ncbi:unnamed protein product [Phytomonas sp. EM1]|nr:unnamed protein product [Phytomonas sp. EM1]|eukprot:CCW65548.1 unnamed protein product [Phytomonas sp. isolate EM1]
MRFNRLLAGALNDRIASPARRFSKSAAAAIPNSASRRYVEQPPPYPNTRREMAAEEDGARSEIEEGEASARDKLAISAEDSLASAIYGAAVREQREIEARINEIAERALRPIAGSFCFARAADEVDEADHPTPTVMVLGNRHAGKSMFINFLAGREIQETKNGDQGGGFFTVIRHGAVDFTEEGVLALRSSNYALQSLHPLGANLHRRLKVKTRVMPANCALPSNLTLIDTPDMLNNACSCNTPSDNGHQPRGYDFIAATRWFARRSDLILLLFDPTNPLDIQITGETLDVLTKSLAGLEQRLLIVLHKADAFTRAADFARCYGALCWNLSRVMPGKEPPRIYAIATPRTRVETGEGNDQATSETAIPAAELVRERNEILTEILVSPLRRLENLITEKRERAGCVWMAARVCNSLRREYHRRVLLFLSSLAFGCVGGPLVVFTALPPSTIPAALATGLSAVGLGWIGLVFAKYHFRRYARELLYASDAVFLRLYAEPPRSTEAERRWINVVRPEILRLASDLLGEEGRGGIGGLPSTPARALRRVERLLSEDLPALGRRVEAFKADERRRLRGPPRAGGTREAGRKGLPG